MSENESLPPLKGPHAESSLIPSKLAQFEHLSTEALLQSLRTGQQHSLKTRQDGTIIDGNHRIHVLRKGQVDVDTLPREVVLKGEL